MKLTNVNIVIGHGFKIKKYTKTLEAATNLLAPDEKLLALFEAGTKLTTTSMAVTDKRIIEFSGGNKFALQTDIAEFNREQLVQSTSTLNLKLGLVRGGSIKYKFFAFGDSIADQNAFVGILQELLGIALPPAPKVPASAAPSPGLHKESVTHLGPKLSKPAAEALGQQQHDSKDTPWLIINTMGYGFLAAFNDRVVIIKTGLWTSVVAGSFGGGRIASFNFQDITGIEYNGGMMNGVLEILTPSYSGTKNHDFWKGTLSSTNADSGNPAQLSNTLILDRSEHRAASKELSVLRKMISDSKKPQAAVVQQADGKSLASQILELKELLDSGILTDQEFDSAKAKLIG